MPTAGCSRRQLTLRQLAGDLCRLHPLDVAAGGDGALVTSCNLQLNLLQLRWVGRDGPVPRHRGLRELSRAGS